MTDATIIAEWTINRRESVRVSVEQFKGIDLINIRKWFEAEDGSLRPGKAGIALNIKHLPQLTEAMTKALALASKHKLTSGQHQLTRDTPDKTLLSREVGMLARPGEA
jgi:hypothetical protein